MIRRLLTVTSVLSLLLCMATVGLWIRSYFISEVVRVAWDPHYHPGGRDANGIVWAGLVVHPSFSILSSRGALYAGTGWGDWMSRHHKVQLYRNRSSTSTNQGFCLFSYETYPRMSAFPNVRAFSLTAWDGLPLGLFMVLPTLWGLRLRRRLRMAMRKQRHHCPRCGYDLRASIDRCPECGTPIPVNDGVDA